MSPAPMLVGSLSHPILGALAAALTFALALPPAHAQPVARPAAAQTASPGGYLTPDGLLARIADAPFTPSVLRSPDGRTLVFLTQPALPGIDEVAAPEMRLAGLRLNARTNGASRTRAATGVSIDDLDGRAERPVTGLPTGVRLLSPRFSPDGRTLAVVREADARLELWAVDLATARARRVGTFALNEAMGTGYAWLPSSDGFIVRAVTTRRPAMPATVAAIPTGPVTQDATGRAAPNRTYQDLLASPSDEAAFAHLATAQVMRVALATGAATPLGAPGLVARADVSPDGRYVLTETIARPFSYVVPANRFPRTVAVVDARTGRTVHTVAQLPLQESVPIAFDAVPDGVRGVSWRADAPATLVWAEALDGGDPARPAVAVAGGGSARDRVRMLAAPFTATPTTLADLAFRFGGATWGRGDVALVEESWWATRRARTWHIAPDAPATLPRLVFDVASEDRYGAPGNPVTTANAAGRQVLLLDGLAMYLTGEGASPEGDRPFLRRRDLASGDTTTLFRSTGEVYESVVAVLDAKAERLLTQRETPTEPPNYWLRDRVRRIAPRPVTRFAHPYPDLAGVQKELIQYRRADGVPLSATLYLPAGYDARRDGPLPTLLWAYPREFKDAAAAGQVTGSPHRFTRIAASGAVPFVTRGYAVLDGATIPIVGEGTAQPNDTFVEQLVASAKAAIDEGVRRGVVDPNRVAAGGHSYGAFMTANLLAHSDLFRAGIARSGAYNRTLTPFGFQSEERTYWQAPELYDGVSPFQNAHKIDEPILLVHGQADNNTGTFPIQSERLFAAIKGLGGTARLVMLPAESHGYAARESILHLLAETDRWLDRYVKNADPRAAAAPTTGSR